MNRIAVFCGSSIGSSLVFSQQAYQLGLTLALQNIELVYGGAKIGLMGEVANGVLQNGGTVIGILPSFLAAKEIKHELLTELIIVSSMHERKTKMYAYSDGIIAMPGGFGTLDELMEVLTWAQLGLHQKPIGLLNVDGYFDALLLFINNMVLCGFLKPLYQQLLLVNANIDELLKMMHHYKAPQVEQWLLDKEL